MAEVKDHITLVKAFLRLRAQCPAMERNVGLVIVGDGVNRSQCLSLLEASGAAQAAWLPGTRLDIERVYRAFDVFVLSSWAEGMPNTILEAMATGLPVVSTDVGAARELIVEGTTGLLVPPRDTDALASSLAELLADETRWRLMGKAGRTRVIQRFSLETMVDRYLDFYACSLAR
jgi:glycosyltransferase involved in cell wall biosynthesis